MLYILRIVNNQVTQYSVQQNALLDWFTGQCNNEYLKSNTVYFVGLNTVWTLYIIEYNFLTARKQFAFQWR
jgi:hypothetical protein